MCSSDLEAGDCAEDDGDVESPAARPEVNTDGSENRGRGKYDVEPPADRSNPSTEAEQAPGDAHASRPVSPQPEQQTASPEPGFSRTFPNIKEFLALAKAELKHQEPSSSSGEEVMRARGERVAIEEELLNAREQRLTNQQKKLQERLRELDAQ